MVFTHIESADPQRQFIIGCSWRRTTPMPVRSAVLAPRGARFCCSGGRGRVDADPPLLRWLSQALTVVAETATWC